MISRHVNLLFEINRGLLVGLPFCSRRREEKVLRIAKGKFKKGSPDRKDLKGLVCFIQGLQISAAATQVFRVAVALGICSASPTVIISIAAQALFFLPGVLEYADCKALKSRISDISLGTSAVSSVALIFLGSPLVGGATLACLGYSLIS